MRRARPGWVYFVRRVDGEGPVKIGVSQSPPERLSSLMAWAPYPLEIAATTPGDEDLEARFHFKFWAQHSHREWFHPSPELDAVISAVAAGTFDASGLPSGPRNRYSKRDPSSAAATSVSLRLTYMGYWEYPIPEHIRTAMRGQWSMTSEQRAERRALVAAWVNEHHPIASRLRTETPRKRAA